MPSEANEARRFLGWQRNSETITTKSNGSIADDKSMYSQHELVDSPVLFLVCRPIEICWLRPFADARGIGSKAIGHRRGLRQLRPRLHAPSARAACHNPTPAQPLRYDGDSRAHGQTDEWADTEAVRRNLDRRRQIRIRIAASLPRLTLSSELHCTPSSIASSSCS